MIIFAIIIKINDMETILTILLLYILGVAVFTIVSKRSPTNKYIPSFDYWSVIKDGMKGMAIGFAIVAALYYALCFILTAIHTGF